MNTSLWFVATVVCVVVLCGPDQRVAAQELRAGVDRLADEIVTGMPAQKDPLRLAVADFPDLQGVTDDLGRYIANRLTTRLTQSPKFSVIERQRLGQILAELKFNMSDLVDPAKAKQLGRMVGVEAIVVGTVSDLGNQVDVDARVIDIETSRMLLSATTTISKDQVVAQLLERGRTVPSVSPSAGTSSNSLSGSQPAAAPGTVADQEFPEFRLDVERLQIASDGTITLFLTYLNKTREELLIGLCDATSRENTFLIDSSGDRYAYRRSSGIEEVCTSGRVRKPLMLDPGMGAVASFTFQERLARKVDGRTFSFASEQVIVNVVGGRYHPQSTHNVFIRNIKPR